MCACASGSSWPGTKSMTYIWHQQAQKTLVLCLVVIASRSLMLTLVQHAQALCRKQYPNKNGIQDLTTPCHWGQITNLNTWRKTVLTWLAKEWSCFCYCLPPALGKMCLILWGTSTVLTMQGMPWFHMKGYWRGCVHAVNRLLVVLFTM